MFYPNPTHDQITLQLLESVGVSVHLFNAMGQELARIPDAQFQQTMEMSQLKEGMYYLKFTKNNSTVTQKLVVVAD